MMASKRDCVTWGVLRGAGRGPQGRPEATAPVVADPARASTRAAQAACEALYGEGRVRCSRQGWSATSGSGEGQAWVPERRQPHTRRRRPQKAACPTKCSKSAVKQQRLREPVRVGCPLEDPASEHDGCVVVVLASLVCCRTPARTTPGSSTRFWRRSLRPGSDTPKLAHRAEINTTSSEPSSSAVSFLRPKATPRTTTHPCHSAGWSGCNRSVLGEWRADAPAKKPPTHDQEQSNDR